MTHFLLTPDNLTSYLKTQGFNPMYEPNTTLTYIMIQSSQYEIPLYFVIRNEGDILQLVAYFPFQLNNSQFASIARFLHLLNRDIDIPGFGMDEEQGLIFYRVVIPCLNKDIDETLLRVYIDTIQLATDGFAHAIGLMNSGQLDLERLKKEVKPS